MYPQIFKAVASSPAATAVLGAAPVRFYPFGEAPQDVVHPYAVWRVISGSPENYLAGRPDIDGFGLQVDVYGSDANSVVDAARAVRDAVELRAHITRWGGQDRDPDTRNYHISFDVDWLTPR